MNASTPLHPYSRAFNHLVGVQLSFTVCLLLGIVGCTTRSDFPHSEAVRVRATQPGSNSAVLAELKRAISPLTTVQPGTTYTDLTAFGEAVGNARLVSLGEATHGSREIFQMKHRLFEYLVREKGFTVFAWEGNWPETEALDRYIKTGEGNPRAALRGLYVWPKRSEEILALVEWMRAFNQAPGDHPILTVAGFDMQRYRIAVDNVLEAVNGTPEATAVEAVYLRILELDDPWFAPDGTSKGDGFAWVNPHLTGIADEADAIVRLLEERQATARTVQMARVVAQALRCRVGEMSSCRDEMMATNVKWFLDEAHPDEKIVVSAHNAHVSYGPGWIGHRLREALGSQMYVLGLAIDAGTVRARRSEDEKLTDPVVNVLPPAAPGTGTAVLSEVDVPMFFLDMRTTRGALRAWLDDEHLFRGIGGGYGDDQDTMWPDRLARSYDGLIFLRETGASRPM